MNKEQLINDFIEHFKSLSETDQFKLGALFNKETGGKLSPYNSPNPVAVALIQVQDGDQIKILAGRRGIQPKLGEVGLIGGFVNKLENAVDGAVREVFEETGLKTEPEDYEYIVDKITQGNQMLIFMKNKKVYPKEIMDTLVLNHEVTEFVLVDENTTLCFPTHQEVANEFFQKNKIQNKKGLKI